MRIPKFRAWDKGKKQMVYGQFEYQIHWTSDRWVCEIHVDGMSKEESPLMQYIGLKDSKDVEIFEGDIFKRPCFGEPCEKGEHIEKVESIHDLCNLDGIAQSSEDLEVVGNIHENPELLVKK